MKPQDMSIPELEELIAQKKVSLAIEEAGLSKSITPEQLTNMARKFNLIQKEKK